MKKNPIIVIAHQKGGVGKSSVAWNIALLLGANVVDLDVQETISSFNDFRKLTDLKPLQVFKFSNHEKLKDYVENYEEEKPLVIDCGGFDSSFNNIAISLADIVITPVSDERAELIGLKKFQGIVANVSEIIGEKVKCFVLLNKIHPNTRNFDDLKSFIKKSEVFGIFDTIIRRKKDISDSAPAGYSVKEFDRNSDSVKDFDNLIKEILKYI